MFTDKVRIFVQAGRGGDGCLSFRREKYVPLGGPDGGNGGRGGDVYFVADKEMTTLQDFTYRPHFIAGNAEHGMGSKKNGRDAEDLYIQIPTGTVISSMEGEEKTFMIDMIEDGQKVLIANGGRGGRGNASFKTQRNTAPRISEKGAFGDKITLELELKLIADVGLIGCPNAGKSTLLSSVTSARPKIANYPFTTLSPNLGVCSYKNKSFVIADIPGLIENAHKGKGLGMEFLRHIERTKMLLHMVDVLGFENRESWKNFELINKELYSYSDVLVKKPMIVVLNKIDSLTSKKDMLIIRKKFEKILKARKFRKDFNADSRIFEISAVTGESTKKLLDEVIFKLKVIFETKKEEKVKDIISDTKDYVIKSEFEVERINDHLFTVKGKKVEKLAQMTHFNQEESVRRFFNILKKMGVERALKRKGVKEADLVRINEMEFEYKTVI